MLGLISKWIIVLPIAGITLVFLALGLSPSQSQSPTLGEISGTKFLDVNSNGMEDSGEQGLKDFIIKLTMPNGTVTTDITDDFGNYSFSDLPEGEYVVEEIQRPNFAQTAPMTGLHIINLAAGQNAASNDFGNVPSTAAKVTSELIDVSAVATARDDDFTDFTVSDTTKPAIPQYTINVTASDFPTSPPFSATYLACLSVGGKVNTPTTVFWRPTKNGTEIGTFDRAVFPSSFWAVEFCPRDTDIATGDVLGVKIWVNAGSTDVSYANLYILPRIITIDDLAVQFFDTTVKSGAVAGVTYSGSACCLYYHRDGGTCCDFRLDFDGINGRRTILKGQQVVADPEFDSFGMRTSERTLSFPVLQEVFLEPMKQMRIIKLG